MQILDLPTTDNDAWTFFREKSILSKRPVCGFDHKAKLYFGKQIFCQCDFKSCQKKVHIRIGIGLLAVVFPL